MQLREPNVPKVEMPNPDPIFQWTAVGAIALVGFRQLLEWLSHVGSWLVKKDSEEVRINEKMIDHQIKTIDQLIEILGKKVV